MKAKVLKFVSRELPPGTVMERRGVDYVKEGCERATPRHKVPVGCWPFAKIMGLPTDYIETPNFISAEQVENMPEWFEVTEDGAGVTETGPSRNI